MIDEDLINRLERAGLPANAWFETHFNPATNTIILVATSTIDEAQSIWARRISDRKYNLVAKLPAGEKISDAIVSDQFADAAFKVSKAHPTTTGRLFAGVYGLDLSNLNLRKVDFRSWDEIPLMGRKFWIERLFGFRAPSVLFALAAIIPQSATEFSLVSINAQAGTLETVERWESPGF